MLWDGDFAVGIRWNGKLGEGVGSPQSRGLPTWFILPRPFVQDVLDIFYRILAARLFTGRVAIATPPCIPFAAALQVIGTTFSRGAAFFRAAM